MRFWVLPRSLFHYSHSTWRRFLRYLDSKRFRSIPSLQTRHSFTLRSDPSGRASFARNFDLWEFILVLASQETA